MLDEVDRFLREREKPTSSSTSSTEIVKVIINIWELMTALTKDIDGQPGSNDQTVGDVYRYFHERRGQARVRAESAYLTLWLEKSEKRFTAFRDEYWVQTYCTPKARVCAVVNGVLDKDEVRRNHEYVRKPSAGMVLNQARAPAMPPLVVRRGGLLGGRREKIRMTERLSTRPSKQSWRFPPKGKTNDG